MPPGKVLAIAELLKEGCGFRKTSILDHASKDGVTSIAMKLGLLAKAIHDGRVRDNSVKEVQLDEKWAYVEKREAL